MVICNITTTNATKTVYYTTGVTTNITTSIYTVLFLVSTTTENITSIAAPTTFLSSGYTRGGTTTTASTTGTTSDMISHINQMCRNDTVQVHYGKCRIHLFCSQDIATTTTTILLN